MTPRKTEGRLVFALGDGQWNIPGLRALLEDIIPKRRTVEAYEVEHELVLPLSLAAPSHVLYRQQDGRG